MGLTNNGTTYIADCEVEGAAFNVHIENIRPTSRITIYTKTAGDEFAMLTRCFSSPFDKTYPIYGFSSAVRVVIENCLIAPSVFVNQDRMRYIKYKQDETVASGASPLRLEDVADENLIALKLSGGFLSQDGIPTMDEPADILVGGKKLMISESGAPYISGQNLVISDDSGSEVSNIPLPLLMGSDSANSATNEAIHDYNAIVLSDTSNMWQSNYKPFTGTSDCYFTASMFFNGAQGIYDTFIDPVDDNTRADAICDRLEVISYNEYVNGRCGIALRNGESSASVFIRVPVSGLASTQQWDMYLERNPLTIVYKRKTPVTERFAIPSVRLAKPVSVLTSYVNNIDVTYTANMIVNEDV